MQFRSFATFSIVVTLLVASCDHPPKASTQKSSTSAPQAATPTVAVTRPTTSLATTQTVKLRVIGMSCPNTCTQKARLALQTLPGIKAVHIDYDGQSATVKYDPEQSNLEDMVAVLEQVNLEAWDIRTEKRLKPRVPANDKPRRRHSRG